MVNKILSQLVSVEILSPKIDDSYGSLRKFLAFMKLEEKIGRYI